MAASAIATAPTVTDFLLDSGIIKMGTWTTPNLVGDNANDPSSTYFSGTEIGHIKGGAVVNLPIEWVSAESQTPRQLLRKDPIRAMFSIECEIYNLSGEHLQALMQRESQLNHAITSPSSYNVDIIHLGPELALLANGTGYLIQATDVNGKAFDIAMYNGLMTPEGQSLSLAGDDYVTLQTKIEATPANDSSLTERTRSYGYIMRRL